MAVSKPELRNQKKRRLKPAFAQAGCLATVVLKWLDALRFPALQLLNKVKIF